MKQQLHKLFENAVDALKRDGVVPPQQDIEIRFDHPRDKSHGDLATNLALSLAKAARQNPRELAQRLIDALPPSEHIAKVEIAGPGFINIFLSPSSQFEVLSRIHRQGCRYGCCDVGHGEKVLIEFVSANPTGPLHVGHGRGAAFGDTLARVMRFAGYEVDTEYYINDAGRQMDILALSVWLRYLELCGEEFSFPKNCYQGDYIWDIAATVHRVDGDKYRISTSNFFSAEYAHDSEKALDQMTSKFRSQVGSDGYQRFLDAALDILVEDIRSDLKGFRVEFDRWFSERSLYQSGIIDRTIAKLKQTEYLYEKDGALWFRATAFGDEKDRVVVRENGTPTYLASDIAYHQDKFDRGFNKLIDVWGADHHGYIDRVKGTLEALGNNPTNFIVTIVQFATLYRGGQKVSMSTRGGEFVTLRELRQEVGTDAARFFYAQRKPEQHLDFDLDLAKSQSTENPVYYVQYAHARVCSVFKQAKQRNIDTAEIFESDSTLLQEEHERNLANALNKFPEIVATAATNREPHHIVYYLRDVSNRLHTYYNAHNVLGTEAELRNARLNLMDATRQVIANGLNLIGVSAPEQM
ncbi:MAG: arginine--tRNA ligase [Arenicellales bacterium]|nr:arginine--tRNA ligase [Arenicellales bacterium]